MIYLEDLIKINKRLLSVQSDKCFGIDRLFSELLTYVNILDCFIY